VRADPRVLAFYPNAAAAAADGGGESDIALATSGGAATGSTLTIEQQLLHHDPGDRFREMWEDESVPMGGMAKFFQA
jgi:hypothetical protein